MVKYMSRKHENIQILSIYVKISGTSVHACSPRTGSVATARGSLWFAGSRFSMRDHVSKNKMASDSGRHVR